MWYRVDLALVPAVRGPLTAVSLGALEPSASARASIAYRAKLLVVVSLVSLVIVSFVEFTVLLVCNAFAAHVQHDMKPGNSTASSSPRPTRRA